MRAHIRKKPTVKEKKAMQKEIMSELAEYNRKNELEIDAVVLWVLHDKFGFGKKRLKKFYDSLKDSMKGLVERYQLDDDDAVWLCTYKLKDELGIDISEWNKESNVDNVTSLIGVYER